MSFILGVIFGGAALMRDTLGLIWQHRRAGLRWLGPVYLLWCLVGAGLSLALDGGFYLVPPSVDPNSQAYDASDLLTRFAVGTAFYTALAVMVHRVVLRPEAVRPRARNMGGYLLWLVVLMAMIMLLLLPVFVVILVVASLSTNAMAENALLQLVLTLLTFVVTQALFWALTRLSLVLPAVAVGEAGPGLRGSWRLTEAVSPAILGFSIALSLLTALETNAVGLLLLLPPILAIVLHDLLLSVAPLIGLAGLTLLYSRLACAGPLR